MNGDDDMESDTVCKLGVLDMEVIDSGWEFKLGSNDCVDDSIPETDVNGESDDGWRVAVDDMVSRKEGDSDALHIFSGGIVDAIPEYWLQSIIPERSIIPWL